MPQINEVSWLNSSFFLFMVIIFSYFHMHFFHFSYFMVKINKFMLFEFNLLF